MRYVILHLPGPAWIAGVSPLEQPGVADHLRHMGAVFATGKIERAGPFLSDGAGGMIVTAQGCSEDDARRIADEDPGVKSGLIRAEVRPWMITLASDAA